MRHNNNYENKQNSCYNEEILAENMIVNGNYREGRHSFHHQLYNVDKLESIRRNNNENNNNKNNNKNNESNNDLFKALYLNNSHRLKSLETENKESNKHELKEPKTINEKNFTDTSGGNSCLQSGYYGNQDGFVMKTPCIFLQQNVNYHHHQHHHHQPNDVEMKKHHYFCVLRHPHNHSSAPLSILPIENEGGTQNNSPHDHHHHPHKDHHHHHEDHHHHHQVHKLRCHHHPQHHQSIRKEKIRRFSKIYKNLWAFLRNKTTNRTDASNGTTLDEDIVEKDNNEMNDYHTKRRMLKSGCQTTDKLQDNLDTEGIAETVCCEDVVITNKWKEETRNDEDETNKAFEVGKDKNNNKNKEIYKNFSKSNLRCICHSEEKNMDDKQKDMVLENLGKNPIVMCSNPRKSCFRGLESSINEEDEEEDDDDEIEDLMNKSKVGVMKRCQVCCQGNIHCSFQDEHLKGSSCVGYIEKSCVETSDDVRNRFPFENPERPMYETRIVVDGNNGFTTQINESNSERDNYMSNSSAIRSVFANCCEAIDGDVMLQSFSECGWKPHGSCMRNEDDCGIEKQEDVYQDGFERNDLIVNKDSKKYGTFEEKSCSKYGEKNAKSQFVRAINNFNKTFGDMLSTFQKTEKEKKNSREFLKKQKNKMNSEHLNMEQKINAQKNSQISNSFTKDLSIQEEKSDQCRINKISLHGFIISSPTESQPPPLFITPPPSSSFPPPSSSSFSPPPSSSILPPPSSSILPLSLSSTLFPPSSLSSFLSSSSSSLSFSKLPPYSTKPVLLSTVHKMDSKYDFDLITSVPSLTTHFV